MIQETMTHACRVCESIQIAKHGTNRCGNAQYHCKDCGIYRVLKPKPEYAKTEQHTVLRACLERCSLRGVARIFPMARQTVARWLKAHVQNLPDVKETHLACHTRRCARIGCASGVVCRRKSKNAGCGQRYAAERGRLWPSSSVTASLATCLRFWKEIPEGYKHCHTFSD
jgi:transposase-like protein